MSKYRIPDSASTRPEVTGLQVGPKSHLTPATWVAGAKQPDPSFRRHKTAGRCRCLTAVALRTGEQAAPYLRAL